MLKRIGERVKEGVVRIVELFKKLLLKIIRAVVVAIFYRFKVTILG